MSDDQTLDVVCKIDGLEEIEGVSLRCSGEVERVLVEQSLGKPDYFSVDITTIQTGEQKTFVVLDKVKPGMEVEINMGYADAGVIFIGEISYIEPRFSESENVVTISGYDYFHRMTRGTNSKTWGDGWEETKTFGAAGGDVIKKGSERKSKESHGLTADAGAGHEGNYLAQYESTDWDFLNSMGVGGGFVPDSRNAESAKKVSFKELSVASAEVTICRDKAQSADAIMCIDAEFTLSTVRQVARVEVRGWHRYEKKPFCGKAEKVDAPAPIEGKEGHKQAGKAHWGSDSAGPVLTIVDWPVEDKAEAEAVAKSIFNELAMQFVRGTVRVEGTPKLKPGIVVELKEFGTRFSGKYLVESVRHIIDGAADDYEPYVCAISVVRNSSPDA